MREREFRVEDRQCRQGDAKATVVGRKRHGQRALGIVKTNKLVELGD